MKRLRRHERSKKLLLLLTNSACLIYVIHAFVLLCLVYFIIVYLSNRCAKLAIMPQVYPSNDDPRAVIEVTKWMRDDALEKATPALIAPHPNTYTYTKRLAETLVASEADKMRVVIIRPSIGKQYIIKLPEVQH